MPLIVTLVLLVAIAAADTRDKRILLHSDTDIAQELQTIKADIARMKLENTQIQSHAAQLQTSLTQLQSTSMCAGSTYVRWGRTTCNATGSTLAYSGYMGGDVNYHTGSAANHVCLTADPIWDLYDEHIESFGKMYGVEYDFIQAAGGYQLFSSNLLNHDAPCAVCHSPRSATMMVSGRNQCYPGWTKEYSGYLVAGSYGVLAASEYICLDRHPETVVGGESNDNENTLHFVEGVCGGSLECPPYINGRELTCVVCTK